MENEKRKRLESAGWKVGSTQEFLNLTDEEAALVEASSREKMPRRLRTRRRRGKGTRRS